jgi:polyhydroxyalkanoate synthesis regulator phasin
MSHKLDEMAKTAKSKIEKVIDDVVEVASLAADKAGRHVHDAGEKVKDAGEKVKDAGERMVKLVG